MASLWASFRARLVVLIILGILPCLTLVLYNGAVHWSTACREAEVNVLRIATGVSQQHRILLDLTRRMLVSLAEDVDRSADPAACPPILRAWSEKRPFLFYADVGLADTSGNVVCSLVPSPRSILALSPECLAQATAARDLSIGPFMAGGVSGKGRIDVAYPVLDNAGSVKLLAFACLDASWFDDLTWRLSLPPGSSVTMIDYAGTVLSRNIDPDKWVGRPAPDVEIINTVLHSGTGVTEAIGLDGVRRIYGFVPLGQETQAGYIYVGIPKDEVVSAAWWKLVRNMGWLALAGVLGLVAVQVFASHSMRTVHTLLRSTQAIAEGDLTVRTGLLPGQGEFGQLGAFFDTMAETLQARDVERKGAEQRLREEKELFVRLIESLPGNFFLIDSAQRLVRWNRRLQRVSGYSDSEITRMNALDFVAAEDRDAAREALEETFRKGGEACLEAQIVTKDRVKLPYWFTGARAFVNGAPCIVGLAVDIGERKCMENALARSEQTLRTILDTVPVGICLTENRVIKWANKCWARMLGFAKEDEYVGKDARILYQEPEEYERAGKALYHGLHASKVTETDTKFTRTDGVLLDANLRMKIVDSGDPACEKAIAVVTDISERKRAEEAVQESARRFRELVESTDLCSVITDAQGGIVFCNDSLLRLTGWDRSEVIGKDRFTLFCSPEHGAALGKCYREAVLQGRTPLHAEFRVLTRHGEERLIRWTTTLLRDANGTISGSASIGEDVTQQREAEDALRLSKETLEGVFHAITEGILVFDPKGRILMANETAAKRLGKPIEQIAGTCVHDLLSPDLADISRARHLEVVSSSSPARFQDQCRDSFLDISLFPILGSAGHVERIAAFARDMTEQRRAEQALLDEKQKFESLCEHAPFGMALIAADGSFLYVNPRFCDAFGYDLVDAPNGRTWFRLAYPDEVYRNEVINIWKHDVATGSRGAISTRIFTVKCKDGTDKIARFITVLLDSGEYLITVEDITEQRESQERLQESEERFRAIFESATDCIFIKDRTARYTHVNPAVEKLFGLPAERLIKMTDEALFGREAATSIKKMESRVLKGNCVDSEATRLVNGVPVTFSLVKVPLHDSAGRIVGVCGIARDITERKHAGSDKPSGAELDAGSIYADYPSAAMRSTLTMARFAAATDSTILLLGESGSGKDHLARFIHDHSLRAGGPYFVVNCASVSAELADSELFGYEPGAFTGATKRKLGLLELAEGGSLLLNEVGELPLPLQAKLLTFLDTSQFTRVGGERNVTVNARILAATNRDLEQEVAHGGFRKDLFYRLNVFAIKIPPLRDRMDDLEVLVRNILAKLGARLQLHAVPLLGPGVMDALASYHWPGNVRELRNVLERALILSQGGLITVPSVPLHIPADDWSLKVEFPKMRSLNDITAEVRKSLLVEALRRTDGNRTRAAGLLGISRHSVINYIREFGIVVEKTHTS